MVEAIKPLEDEVCELIARVMHYHGRIEASDTLINCGVNSADIALLINELEEYFGVSLSQCSILPETPVGSICDEIQNLLSPF